MCKTHYLLHPERPLRIVWMRGELSLSLTQCSVSWFSRLSENGIPQGWVKGAPSISSWGSAWSWDWGAGKARAVWGAWKALQRSLTNGFICGLPATESCAGMRRMMCLVKTFSNTRKLSMQFWVRKEGWRLQSSSELRDVSSFHLRTKKGAVRGHRRKGLRTRNFLFFSHCLLP